MTRPLASSAMPATLFAVLPVWALVAQPADPVMADPLTAPLQARLAGTAEGAGRFEARFNDTFDRLCYVLTVDGIARPVAAQIRLGALGETGSPVVTLQPPAGGTAKACATLTAELAIRLSQHPERYHVTVADAAHPQGGLRGQLGR